MEWLTLVHHTVCGAVAAAGFGVLFNISSRSLPWCALGGALALSVRTVCLSFGWSLEGASFMSALMVGLAVHLLHARAGISYTAMDVAGCIPMVPGSFAAKAILGLFSLTAQNPSGAGETLVTAVEYTLRVLFTVGAIGTGLAIPTLLLRVRVKRAG